MGGYFRILAAIPGFFLSSLFLMWMWRWMAPDFNWALINYPQAMKVTIMLWLAVAPLAAVGAGRHRWWQRG